MNDVKGIVKQALTEDFVKKNNKVFSLSDQTTKNYLTVSNYIHAFRRKNLNEFESILSEDIVLYTCNEYFSDKNTVIEMLFSCLSTFNPKNFPIESVNLSIKLAVSTGGGFSSTYNCCPEDSGLDDDLFIVPWDHMFSCMIKFEYNNIATPLNMNHILKFDDHGKINNIILYTM